MILAFSSCNKADQVDLIKSGPSELDWSLYPDGDSVDYAQNHWPVWSENTNALRNVLFEDFAGHQCSHVPNATLDMENLIATNPDRMFSATIHSSPSGLSAFQTTSALFPNVLYNEMGLEVGSYFGGIQGSSFVGIPAFNVNRVKTNDQFTSNAGLTIANKANACLASALQVNIQAATNYFPSTRGLFLHTEIDVIDNALTSELGVVVYLIEDSLVGPQTGPLDASFDTDGTVDGINYAYVHRNIMRGCIDGNTFGRTLGADDLNTSNGKYYLNYSYHLPDQYNVNNMHLLIYVYDKVTMEIYQVIEKYMN